MTRRSSPGFRKASGRSCDSWYRAASGRVTTNWPGLVHEYQRRTRSAVLADYAEVRPRPAAEEIDA